jgi:hypothetical protein
MQSRVKSALSWIRAYRREYWLFHGGAFAAGVLVWLVCLLAGLWFLGAMVADVTDLKGHVPRSFSFFPLLIGAGLFVGAGVLANFGQVLYRDGVPLLRINATNCARLIAELAGEPMKVSYDDLRKRLPGCAVMETAEQCLALPGVIKLEVRPAGMSLTEKTRAQLRAAA